MEDLFYSPKISDHRHNIHLFNPLQSSSALGTISNLRASYNTNNGIADHLMNKMGADRYGLVAGFCGGGSYGSNGTTGYSSGGGGGETVFEFSAGGGSSASRNYNSSSNYRKESYKYVEDEQNEHREKKIRKQRYAFHTRSAVDILDDGYRWRKYGQKAVKNNKFPRSYYRCTHPGCNVKKQVQRQTKDEETVETIYEGIHSHSVEKSTDNFEHILKQMHIYVPT